MMMIGYLIDGFIKVVLSVIAVAALSFVVTCVVIIIGEKTKWW